MGILRIFKSIFKKESEKSVDTRVKQEESFRIQESNVEDSLVKNFVSAKKATKRSSSEKKQKKEKTVKPMPVFDEILENSLIRRLAESEEKRDLVERHFVYNDILRFYYRYRKLDNKYAKLCEKYCLDDIASIYDMEKQEIAREIKRYEDLRDVISAKEFRENVRRIKQEGFLGNIIAFRELKSLYMEQKRFDEAISVCDKAIAWGHDAKTYWVEEKEKTLKKIEKLNL